MKKFDINQTYTVDDSVHMPLQKTYLDGITTLSKSEQQKWAADCEISFKISGGKECVVRLKVQLLHGFDSLVLALTPHFERFMHDEERRFLYNFNLLYVSKILGEVNLEDNLSLLGAYLHSRKFSSTQPMRLKLVRTQYIETLTFSNERKFDELPDKISMCPALETMLFELPRGKDLLHCEGITDDIIYDIKTYIDEFMYSNNQMVETGNASIVGSLAWYMDELNGLKQVRSSLSKEAVLYQKEFSSKDMVDVALSYLNDDKGYTLVYFYNTSRLNVRVLLPIKVTYSYNEVKAIAYEYFMSNSVGEFAFKCAISSGTTLVTNGSSWFALLQAGSRLPFTMLHVNVVTYNGTDTTRASKRRRSVSL